MQQAAATTNFYVHQGATFINIVQLNEAPTMMNHYYFNQIHHDQTPPSPQAIFAFIVTVLLNLIPIKYQGNVESPFETHPKTMFLAIACLLLYYCFTSCDTKPITTTTNICAVYCNFVAISMEFCGSLSLASLSSFLLPESLSPLVFSLSLLFSLSRVLPPSHIQTIWDLLKKASIFILHKVHPQPTHHATRRRRGGGVQVQIPWLPQDVVHSAIFNQVDVLPV